MSIQQIPVYFSSLKPLDVEFMKRLHDKVNIIPLISKADSLTPDECREFKKTVSHFNQKSGDTWNEKG